MHGHGKYRWSNGCEYTGEFVENVKHGFGEILQPNGKKYIGGWKYDK